MRGQFLMMVCLALMTGSAAGAEWWNATWRYRTTVTRSTPYRDEAHRPVEAAVDFPLLLKKAGIAGEFDPASVRVVEDGREVPSAVRTEFDARRGREQVYVTWIAQPKINTVGAAHIYFDTKDRGIEKPNYDAASLPPENLLANAGFEIEKDGRPDGWQVSPPELFTLAKFNRAAGERSVRIAVDEKTPGTTGRIAMISQKIDVRRFAGQEMVFESDLLAERAAYGAPMTVELQQFRADGSRIPEYAVQPRWLSLELAQGQMVQFCERGRFAPAAATVDVVIRVRCEARDADTGKAVTGPESHFTVWLDRVVVRPGERWPWPAESHAGFAEGALPSAPLNRGFEFTGQRRLAFNGASEGTLTANAYNPDPKSAHWGVAAGTIEFWCKPKWNSDDGKEHIFFDAKAYMHRLQCRLRKCDARGKNQIEFTIGDSNAKPHTIQGSASLKADAWHHIAATWDLSKAHMQLFVDGKPAASDGPGKEPWPFSLAAKGDEKLAGLGVTEDDKRSLPMQAFIGGDCNERAEFAAEAVMDEFRVSDVERYTGEFAPPREEFKVDEHTRALWRFENERHGVHDSDDRYVQGHLSCELQPLEETAPIEINKDGNIESRMVVVKPRPPEGLFEKNRAENNLPARRAFVALPDPRFVEFCECEITRMVAGGDDAFALDVGGDLEPLMRSITFERSDAKSAETTLLPRWRANDNVLPFSAESIAATLAPNVKDDAERAFLAFKYAVEVTNYFDAHYAETLPDGRHRPRVSYVFTKGINIYPFDQCGPLNHVLRKLFLAVGISSSNASGTHHQFEQAFYKGAWRLFDLSSRIYWLDRDDETVIGRRHMEDDPWLKLRQGGDFNAWIPGRKSSATFGSAERPHNMDFFLRPGERASVCWHNEGRWFEVTEKDRSPIPLAKIPPYFGNGAILYEPTVQGDAAVFNNLRLDGRTLQPVDPTKEASLFYRIQCPYILSDLRITGSHAAAQDDAVRLTLSFDQGQNWNDMWRSGANKGGMAVHLTREVMGYYACWLKLELAPNTKASLKDLAVRTTFVVSPLSLPGKLRKGSNRITFHGKPSTTIKTTCRWVERRKSDAGIGLNAVSYYMNSGEAHRNVFVVPPKGTLPVQVSLLGRSDGTVTIANLPEGWECKRADKTGRAFLIGTGDTIEGDIRAFQVVVRSGDRERRAPTQVLVARAAMAQEAEAAAEITGEAKPADLPEASGAKIVAFAGDGRLAFDLNAPSAGTYAMWFRARWEENGNTAMTLSLDGGKARNFRPTAMIGFTDWTSPQSAHTKMFAHYGEQYGHWSWYRLPDIELAAGAHRLTIGAGMGTCLDALLMLPQNPAVDRAAMNLFQNWNYAPWDNPM
ncbi:MAG: LamG-like jellyroll fold domain-containing protein [Planctomycetota bacterium]